jgi:hypothetical protein
MGRIRRKIEVLGKPRWTLFDSGSRNTYVAREAVAGLVTSRRGKPWKAAIGGTVHQVKETCVLKASIDNHEIETLARVVDEIGQDEDGKPIEILFGALSMQEWGIHLDLPNERLDLSHYSTTFVEF